ncbi:BlaI/MecI/CopY family transcriptional regulator [Gemmatimonas sp. UBA7669]|uniref:BlaI/MecI/CopY family transcriptional regulator n=1 Tax=Gemmatimonas sp. UBA7669 TaxID=1946568 RepID=UPI0025C5E629|nr:BlaI/MecI/CopY family transcriptional regulator [Gemmatimonas sp. UBA7669]
MAPRKTSDSAPASPRLPGKVRLSGQGLGAVLGDLESRLMRLCWDAQQPLTAREIHEQLRAEHPVSPLTSTTVLNRLVTKGFLSRTRVDGLLRYQPQIDESAFVAQASRHAVEGILSLGTAAVTASIVDVLAERDPAQLQELARLIQRRLGEREG